MLSTTLGLLSTDPSKPERYLSAEIVSLHGTTRKESQYGNSRLESDRQGVQTLHQSTASWHQNFTIMKIYAPSPTWHLHHSKPRIHDAPPSHPPRLPHPNNPLLNMNRPPPTPPPPPPNSQNPLPLPHSPKLRRLPPLPIRLPRPRPIRPRPLGIIIRLWDHDPPSDLLHAQRLPGASIGAGVVGALRVVCVWGGVVGRGLWCWGLGGVVGCGGLGGVVLGGLAGGVAAGLGVGCCCWGLRAMGRRHHGGVVGGHRRKGSSRGVRRRCLCSTWLCGIVCWGSGGEGVGKR